ncbi:winged helix-turn-helix transcriptional regulator [Nonomuraea dietziae]|uniref:DNA-binding HxlR family transcriptional regulator n=1 Tax=Nonomuraea dietziae TaxID=65515 RepID=A0A7W5UVN6_9ACTN|nr:helix-turn-helix domain-containing protein [Nonomuraea dietziae]MBB3725506.1 DNA-binding HxlR family transcriptional regulator [Nonomuraea dietziae]
MKRPRPCSIADALAVIGEKHSLLVLREVFYGVRRFDGLVANIGAPRDILAARLRRLVEAGVLEKVPYQEHPPRFEYHLTDAGRELRPVLLTLMQWGDRHLADVPPVVFEHACGADLEPRVVCRACGEEPTEGSLTARFRDPGWTAAGAAAATDKA